MKNLLSILVTVVILSIAKQSYGQMDGSDCGKAIILPLAAQTCSEQPLKDFTMDSKEKWFRFFTLSGAVTISALSPTTPPTAQITKLSLFDGTCPNLTLIKEVTSTGAIMPSIDVNGLKAGKRYYIKTEEGNAIGTPGNFKMCLTKNNVGGNGGGGGIDPGGKPAITCSNAGTTNAWKDNSFNVFLCPESLNVAIGKTYANDKLHIKSDGNNNFGITIESPNESYLKIGNTDYGSFIDNATPRLDIYAGGELSIDATYTSIFGNAGVVGNLIVSGNVGIGCTAPAYKLTVNGTVRCEKVIVADISGCDFVLEKDYKLPSLQWRKDFTGKYKHLPNVKPAKEMERDGIELGEYNGSILQNVEEHELYLYQHDARLEKLEKKIGQLEKIISAMKKENEELKKQVNK